MNKIYKNCQNLRLQIIIPHTRRFIMILCLFVIIRVPIVQSLCYYMFIACLIYLSLYWENVLENSFTLVPSPLFFYSLLLPLKWIGIYLYLGINYTGAEENNACCCLKGIIQPELALWKTKWTFIINIHFQWLIKNSGKNPCMS